MASVRIDKPNDGRFKLLGKLLGTNHFDAKGRMIDVWEWCTDRETYFISEALLNAIGERDDFADCLVAADLAEKTEQGVRVKGTEGRIEWLAAKRANGRLGGRPKEEDEEKEPNDNLDETSRLSDEKPNGNPITIALPLSPTITTSNNSSRRAKRAPVDGPTPGSQVWDAYSAAFKKRWGDDPPRNAEANSLCKRLVEKLGVDDAPSVAEFYVSHKDAFYVKAMHPLTLLIRDATRIRTEWSTGRVSTAHAAKEGDLQQHNRQVMRDYLAREVAK